jgi:membrane protein required for colicin V production
MNPVDIMVIIIFALSMLWGFMRGFIKEAISLVSWIAAAIIASTFASPLAAHFGSTTAAMQSAVGSATMAQPISLAAIAIAFIVIFVAVLFAGSIIGYILAGAVSVTGLGFINRILGAGFGFARGYIMVIIFMFVCELTPMGAQPAWSQSQFVADFAPAVAWFSNIVQPGIAQIKAYGTSAVQNLGNTATQGYSAVIQGVGSHN